MADDSMTFAARTFLAGCGDEYRAAVERAAGAFAPFEASWERRGRFLVCSWDIPGGVAAETKAVVASLAALTPGDYGYCVELEGSAGGDPTARAMLTAVGIVPRAPEPAHQTSGPGIVCDVDNFVLARSFDGLTLRVYLSADALPERWLLSVSCRTGRRRPIEVRNEGRCELDVPGKSQMTVPDIGKRICSPTSIAMLLEYHGFPSEPAQAARAAYCAEHDLFGVWPWNIYAASRRGLLGFLAYFDEWQSARLLIEMGRPLIASIRYGKGELTGAAVARDSDTPLGHLVVIRGFDGQRVLVNDPGAAADEEVARAYDLAEFLRVWLGRSALAYVFP